MGIFTEGHEESFNEGFEAGKNSPEAWKGKELHLLVEKTYLLVEGGTWEPVGEAEIFATFDYIAILNMLREVDKHNLAKRYSIRTMEMDTLYETH